VRAENERGESPWSTLAQIPAALSAPKNLKATQFFGLSQKEVQAIIAKFNTTTTQPIQGDFWKKFGMILFKKQGSNLSIEYYKADEAFKKAKNAFKALSIEFKKNESDPVFGPLIDCLLNAASLNDPIYDPRLTSLVNSASAGCWGFSM